MKYCKDLFSYSRLQTREVMCGALGIGGDQPIRIQSMTTTNTLDTKATVAQSIRMIEAGAELIRITAPSLNEAQNLAAIKKSIRDAGFHTPLVADIHFTPNAAELAARIVEKVRINPGNYADKKKFEQIEYSDHSYAEELERIRERFLPLVRICKEYGTAMRIGTNHGSLSDRILSRFGDTPLGMVESAMEFLTICEEEKYYNVVLSMKASNPQVMVQAYRLLASRMLDSGRHYPLHLGVTEAGDGEDGRIKSAVGIGALLEDGLGDTIRVSLTEDPEAELPVARKLVERYSARKCSFPIPSTTTLGYDPLQYVRRSSKAVVNVGGRNVPVVVADLRHKTVLAPSDLEAVGYSYDPSSDKWNISDQAADFIFLNQRPAFERPGMLRVLLPFPVWRSAPADTWCLPFFSLEEFQSTHERSPVMNVVFLSCYDETSANDIQKILKDKNVVLALSTANTHAMPAMRRFFMQLSAMGSSVPVILTSRSADPDTEGTLLHHAVECGSLLLDGFGDGILLHSEHPAESNRTAFGILQATRTRISKTEYISCPSCGRTLFDLQETTARIRSRTSHLKGVKIGIMGCIVNGPGEMADADYGYVGTGPGKITLYKGKEVVRRNIDAEHAVDELIALIREHGDWIENR